MMGKQSPITMFASRRGAVLGKVMTGAAALTFLSAPSISVLSDASLAATGPEVSIALQSELADFTVQGEALIADSVQTAQDRNARIPMAAALAETARPFTALRSDSAIYGTALGCLTEAIYYEAANESVAGKRGVAQVILNRVAHYAYPSSVCGVVYQGYREPVCQFSYTCDGSLARRPLADLWRQSEQVAAAALAGYTEEAVGTATHYHADYVLPYWAFRLDKVHVEGRHLFYRLPDGAGRLTSFGARYAGREFHPTYDPSRFADVAKDDASVIAEEVVPAHLQPDVTDRRAENDVGGRMDPTAGWTLTIPDPVAASDGYRAAMDEQADSQPMAPQLGDSESEQP